MAITGKQSPLGAGVNGSLLQNIGLCLNPPTVGYVGTSHVHNYNDGDDSYSPGSVVDSTCLFWLTYGINKGYYRVKNSQINSTTYGNLISIGSNTIPALGNTKPPTFTWYGPANTGDPSDSPFYQDISWYPYISTNTTNLYPDSDPTPKQYSNLTETKYYRSITQWGWIRLFALQAWNEFNWNGYPNAASVYYKEFLSSFDTIAGFISYANSSINSQAEAPSFLKNTYSNMDDLISADIVGVSKATGIFGQDLITLGKVIDLTKVDKFGLPSVLLQTLKKYNAVTPSLTYALISSGISQSDLTSIINGAISPTKLQEQQLYGAFSIIQNDDLKDILVPLNCGTKGLTTLVDLLDPVKLFPNSYLSLTVPIYNGTPGPTNSKTYYLIYVGTSVNPTLKSPEISSLIGTLGIPPLSNTAATGSDFQAIPIGFNSYLQGIVPDEVAYGCGAVSVALRQIKNIKNVPFEKFAQVVANIETTRGLPLTAGTNVPSNTTLTNDGLTRTAFGSGPNGSWTMSDFLGSMSGLPYPWRDIQSLISGTQTVKLTNIYQELYLATHWDGATGTVHYTTRAEKVSSSPDVYNYYYTISGVSIDFPGGGYTRGGAVAPTAVITGTYSGSVPTVTTTVDYNVRNVPTSYGTVTKLTMTPLGEQANGSGSSATPPDPNFQLHIQCPPTATLAVQSNGNKSTSGVNTSYGTTGWSSPMEAVVQAYITQANTEVASIYGSNVGSNTLNKNWNITGTQLTIEQRARDIALNPVPTPKDNRLNPYPIAIHAYVDSLPSYAKKTEPHMHAQTIDAISDLSTPGGQSIVAQQRTERNQSRLLEAGITLDDTMGAAPTPMTTKLLMANGSISIGAPEQGVPAGNATFTIPANQEVVGAKPQGYFDQVSNSYVLSPMNTSPVLGTIPEYSEPGLDDAGPGIIQIDDPITPISGGSEPGTAPQIPSATYTSPSTGATNLLPLGQPVAKGSLAGSPYQNIFPPQLSVAFTSGILPPAQYSIPEAIDEVVKCNCDCWIE